MNNRPVIDRELLIPILIGGFSVVGIVAVLLIGRALHSPAEVTATPSATPFRYVYLGTEPAVTTLVVDGSELPPTDESTATALATPTRRPASTPIILPTRTATGGAARTSTPSRAPTVTRTSTASAANTYDDTDSRLHYEGSWVPQIGVDNAYQNTLHISYTAGNSVTFTFTGTEIHFFYQAGQSLGSMTVTIDGVGPPPISQAQSTTQIKEWVPSETLSNKTHTIVITHYGGGSINIDRFFIPAATPTPTRTPTP